MARHPADCSDAENANISAATLLAEVKALRRRLAALEERLPGNIPDGPAGRQAKRRAFTKTVVWLTTGAMLAMLAGASVVYGDSAVEALFISKEGNVAIGPSRLDPNNNYKLHVSTSEAKTSTNGGAGFAVTTNEAGNPFGLGIRLTGAPALADRSAVLITTDVNLGDGGHLVLQPSPGNVGIGTLTPNADNKLEVNGKIAATSLNVAGSATTTGLNVTGSATTTGLNVTGSATITGLKVPGMGIDGKHLLEFGAGVDGKQGEAGKIGYQVWTDGLDIVGAGNKLENRKITFFAEGGATFAGGLKVDGAVDGNMKVVYQRDDEPQTTYQKPLWRYHMSLTAAKYAGRTKTIPSEILTALCGKQDGCEVRLGMTRWDNAILTETASRSTRLYIGDNGRWRTSDDREGVVGNGRTEHAMDAWDTCYLTDGTYDNYQDKGDKQTGLQLLVWNNGGKYNNPARTCELTIIP